MLILFRVRLNGNIVRADSRNIHVKSKISAVAFLQKSVFKFGKQRRNENSDETEPRSRPRSECESSDGFAVNRRIAEISRQSSVKLQVSGKFRLVIVKLLLKFGRNIQNSDNAVNFACVRSNLARDSNLSYCRSNQIFRSHSTRFFPC